MNCSREISPSRHCCRIQIAVLGASLRMPAFKPARAPKDFDLQEQKRDAKQQPLLVRLYEAWYQPHPRHSITGVLTTFIPSVHRNGYTDQLVR